MHICLEHNFDHAKIMAHFKKFEPDNKYSGLEAYEWNTTKSRQELQNEKKKKAIQAERQQKYLEEKELRQQKFEERKAAQAKKKEELRLAEEKKAAEDEQTPLAQDNDNEKDYLLEERCQEDANALI